LAVSFVITGASTLYLGGHKRGSWGGGGGMGQGKGKARAEETRK